MTTLIQQTRITLKNLKVAEFASQETLCFTATVLLDGKPIAQACNEGNGGPTSLDPHRESTVQVTEAEAFAKSLPPVLSDFDDPHDPSRKMSLPVTLDFLIDVLAVNLHAEKKIRAAFKRDIVDKVLFIKEGELLFLKNLKLKTIADKPNFFAKLRAKHGIDITILAELPPDEAFEVWKRYTLNSIPS